MAAPEPRIFHGGWYIDATDREHVVLFPGKFLQNSSRDIPLPSGQNLLQFRLAADSVRFAGAGHDGPVKDMACEWNGVEWVVIAPAHGVNACIYDAADRLRLPEHAITGSQGWRQVADDGRLITADSTYVDPVRRVWEYTTYGDVTIGQGGDGPHGQDPVIALYKGKRYVLAAGMNRFVRFRRYGDLLVICWVGQGYAGLFRINVNQLSQFTEQITDQPKTDPKEPEKPKDDPKPMPENKLGLVSEIRKKYGTPLGGQHWQFLVDVAQATGAKLFRKDGGSNVFVPPLNLSVSQDIIILDGFWIDILGDAENEARPAWDAHPNAGEPEKWLDVSRITLPGKEPPKDPPKDEPKPTNIEQRLAKAQADIIALTGQVFDLMAKEREQTQRIDALADAVETLLKQGSPKYKVVGKTSRAGTGFLAHAHSIEVQLEPMDD